jgi:hypothetical protein
MVPTVVEDGKALQQDAVRALTQERHAIRRWRPSDGRELVRGLTRHTAKMGGEGELVPREKVDRELRGSQADSVGVVRLRQPYGVVEGVDAGLSMEPDEATGSLVLRDGRDDREWRVERTRYALHRVGVGDMHIEGVPNSSMYNPQEPGANSHTACRLTSGSTRRAGRMGQVPDTGVRFSSTLHSHH